MSGPRPPADWSLEQILTSSRNALYLQVAGTVVGLYDHVTTFDREVELIWGRKWSVTQFLYFVNRYAGGALLLHGTAYQLWVEGETFRKACRTGGLVQMVLSMITWGAMQAIMINRLWCMYRRSKAILTLLSLALLAETICSSIIVALNYEVANVVVEWSPNFVMCVPTGFASSFYLFWIFILVFDILIFMLALLEGLKYFREVARQRELHDSGQLVTFGSVLWGPREGTLLRVLLRDSILFPFLTLASCIIVTLAWFEVLPHGTLQAGLVVSGVLAPVLGCRLILNLRELYYQPFSAEFQPPTQKNSDPPFSPVTLGTSDYSLELPVRPTRPHVPKDDESPRKLEGGQLARSRSRSGISQETPT